MCRSKNSVAMWSKMDLFNLLNLRPALGEIRLTFGFSKKITACAGIVLGVAKGGKVATGVNPCGTRLSCVGVAVDGIPPPAPPGIPGAGLPGGVIALVVKGNWGKLARPAAAPAPAPAAARGAALE